MPSLADSQAGFAAALGDPERAAPGDIARPPGRRQTRRFDVYRNNIAVSLIEALASAFPAVERLVGQDFFRAAARAYAAGEPPRSPLLFRYGATFGDFLDRFPPARRVAYLGDVARLEFARLQAYHAADAASLAIGCLAGIPPCEVDRVTFAFHPSAALVRSRFPVVSLWSAVTGPEGDARVDMKRAEDALVLRRGLEVDTRILPAGGAVFMTSLMAGGTLAAAAGQAADGHPGFDLSAHLAGLFETGAVVAVNRA